MTADDKKRSSTPPANKLRSGWRGINVARLDLVFPALIQFLRQLAVDFSGCENRLIRFRRQNPSSILAFLVSKLARQSELRGGVSYPLFPVVNTACGVPAPPLRPSPPNHSFIGIPL